MNWEELLACFRNCEAKLSLHARYKCRLIKEMLTDRTNYLYFIFITPIVQEFEKINSVFQQTNGDPYELSKELLPHNESLHSRLYDKNGSCKSLEYVILVLSSTRKLVFIKPNSLMVLNVKKNEK